MSYEVKRISPADRYRIADDLSKFKSVAPRIIGIPGDLLDVMVWSVDDKKDSYFFRVPTSIREDFPRYLFKHGGSLYLIKREGEFSRYFDLEDSCGRDDEQFSYVVQALAAAIWAYGISGKGLPNDEWQEKSGIVPAIGGR